MDVVKNVQNVKLSPQNQIFIRIERRKIVIDHLVVFVVRIIIMIIKTEYLTIIKFILTAIDQK